MKLVSLNVWGGSLSGPLMDYIGKLSVDTDIFCFQEVFSSLPGAPEESGGARMFLFEELTELLKDHSGFFDLRSQGWDFNKSGVEKASHGLSIFIKNNLQVKSSNSKLISISEASVDTWVKAQIIKIGSNNKQLSIINFHGISNPGDKLDNPKRIEQSLKLAEIWESLGEDEKILTGDFNLMPETESIKILERCGTNLIREFKIENTRNEVSWKRFSNKQYFADYCFVSSGVKVRNFQVPYNEVSDHLPMILEFDI